MKDVYYYSIDDTSKYGGDFTEICNNLKAMAKAPKLIGEDRLTAISRNLTYLYKDYFDVESEKLGLIYVTEYGNINSMINMAQLAYKGEYISTKLFPNSMISSASNATSILLKTKGLNLTINGGFVGYCLAMELGYMYIQSGELDGCIILSGDEYVDFSILDVRNKIPDVDDYFSNVTLAYMSSRYMRNNNKGYLLENLQFSSVKMDNMNSYYGQLFWKCNCLDEIRNAKYYASSFPYYAISEAIKYGNKEIEICFMNDENNLFSFSLKEGD